LFWYQTNIIVNFLDFAVILFNFPKKIFPTIYYFVYDVNLSKNCII
jgi:hypothetical protein